MTGDYIHMYKEANETVLISTEALFKSMGNTQEMVSKQNYLPKAQLQAPSSMLQNWRLVPKVIQMSKGDCLLLLGI